MVRFLPSARYLAGSVARSNGLLIIALRGRGLKASARRFACSRPVSVSSIPGSRPGSRCSTFHVVCPCRIRNSVCFISACVLSILEDCTLELNAPQDSSASVHPLNQSRCDEHDG